jgi:hypothetical protein
MMTAFIVAVGSVLMLGLCGYMAYRIGFHAGREQGLTDAYRLYAGNQQVPGEGHRAAVKVSNNARVVVGSALFALASSTLLHLFPRETIDRHLHGTFGHWRGDAYATYIRYTRGEFAAARLYEDGKLLGPPDSDPQDIAADGSGRYRLYRDPVDNLVPILMFSASDNTDPNSNGRTYSLE